MCCLPEYQISYLKEFGLSTEEVGRLLAFKPHLMGCSIEERWKPLVKYFYYLGISKEGMKRILVVKPILYCIDLEKTIAPKVFYMNFLLDTMNYMQQSPLTQLLLCFLKVRFFQDMGIPNEAIGNMLVKFPSLLTNSLYKKIRPVVSIIITFFYKNQRWFIEYDSDTFYVDRAGDFSVDQSRSEPEGYW